MTTIETGGHNPHEGGDVQFDGGEPSDDDPDWEHLARRSESSTLDALFENDLGEAYWVLTDAIGSGEPIDDQHLENLRGRFAELEERVTYTLRDFGELNTRTPAERLATEVRSIDHVFRRAARSARRGKLCRHELDRAREALERAEKTLDSLEEDLEE